MALDIDYNLDIVYDLEKIYGFLSCWLCGASWGFNEGLLHPSLQQPTGKTTRSGVSALSSTRRSWTQKKSKEAPLNLLTSLSGVSWRQVEHLVDKVADAEDGFQQVLSQLDRCFKYDDRVEMPRALEKFFYGATRRGDQTLMQYCADHREARRELERHKISLPDAVSGWLLLRRSSLTYEQRQMVQTHCSSLDEIKVEESLYYLFGQDYRGRSDVRWGANATPAKLHQRWPRRQHAYNMDEVYEHDEDLEHYEEDFNQD